MELGAVMHGLRRAAAVVLAGLTTACSGAAERVTSSSCLEAGRWTRTGAQIERAADGGAIIEALAGRQVVVLGEQHDEVDHHRWQLQALAALHSRRPQLQIGFEMFPRRLQPVLDRWVAGELSVIDFIREAEWNTVWNMPVELYLPLFQFARINRIPMLALNVEPSLTRSIARLGWAGVAAAEREGIGQPAPPSAAYREQLYAVHHLHQRMRGSAGEQAVNAAAESAPDAGTVFRNFVDSQLAWDRAMAEALYAALQRQPESLVVGIIGSGHLRHGHGVPHQLRALGMSESEIGIALPLAVDTPCAEVVPGLADAVFALPVAVQPVPPPPRLGVSLETASGGVRLVEVQAGSLAERSGLRADDLVVEAAGQRLRRTMPLVALVRSAAPGVWLPLRVRRGDEEFELVVRFPADEE